MIFPRKVNLDIIKNYFKKVGLKILLSEYATNSLPSVSLKSQTKPYKPNLIDLYNLHNLIIKNKRLEVLEFGSGWSTVVIANALKFNKFKYKNKISNIRVDKPFFSLSIENNKRYLNITKKRINDLKLNSFNNFFFQNCEMTYYNGQISTEYKKLPNFNPDLIYLDGPDQSNIRNNSFGININYKNFTPMSCDVLKIEFFLNPGTIIISDGRSRNVEFLRKNMKRNWSYKYLEWCDQHYLILDTKPNGLLSKNRLDFYKN